jgi:hypothetical protein
MEATMSIDISAHLYFPISRAAAALNAVEHMLRHDRSRPGITLITPGGEAITISAYPDSARKNEEMTFVLGEGVDVRGLVAGVPCLAGKGPSGAIDPGLDHAAIELLHRDGKTFAVIPVDLGFARGREHLGITVGTFISSVVSAFHSPRFRSRLSRVLVDGGGVVAVYCGMGEWSSFADPGLGVEIPPGCDPGEAGIDAFVDFLTERLS